MSTHNLCFRTRKNVYPCAPQFYYTKVGCKGVFVTRTCFRDETCHKTIKDEDSTDTACCVAAGHLWEVNATGNIK